MDAIEGKKRHSAHVEELLAEIRALKSKNRQKMAQIDELCAENEELRSKIRELSQKSKEPAIIPPKAGHLGKTAADAVYSGNYALFTDGACEPNPGLGG